MYPWTPKPWKIKVSIKQIWVITSKNEGCGCPFPWYILLIATFWNLTIGYRSGKHWIWIHNVSYCKPTWQWKMDLSWRCIPPTWQWQKMDLSWRCIPCCSQECSIANCSLTEWKVFNRNLPFPYAPCMEYLPYIVDFYGQCRQIYHTWSIWVLQPSFFTLLPCLWVV